MPAAQTRVGRNGKAKTCLVVVESPTKARTIRGFLPEGYRVAASMGHIRDLPESAAEIPTDLKDADWARLGVDTDGDFRPLYVVPASKKKVVQELKTLLRDADELMIATDEDREGESIGWHVLEVLNPKVPVSRIVFHEITPEAIREAIRNPRAIDSDLVRAQETRRILDRLVGYTVSPLLWKKIARGLSAGRVQSVAVRLLVERERERRAFRTAVFWDLLAELAATQGAPFGATLVELGGKRLATGKDFDPQTGRLVAGREVVLLDEPGANALRDQLRHESWTVRDSEEKPQIRRPAPPFTTSTLQQEANRKLRLSARETMQIAQRLYEQGFITYMRTDSVHLSDQAITAARGRIESRYGAEFLSPKPRQFTTKTKGAQEAHEAIRPAGTEMRSADELDLSGRDRQLYELIWKRTVASQMADGRVTQLVVRIAAGKALFRAAGQRIDFPGFFRAYVEGSDDPEAELQDRETLLPAMRVGERLTLQGLDAVRHETQPPARYTEATLVKALESEGIGRPSTYAAIIGTIIDRGYVTRIGNQLAPTWTAFAVTGLLERHFPSLVDTSFTAGMEEHLDEIARGEAEWLPYLHAFFFGDEGLQERVRAGERQIDPREASTVRLEGLPAPIRIGRFGPFVEKTTEEGSRTASLPDDIAPADLSDEQIATLLEKSGGPEPVGTDPVTGESVFLLIGPYGPYVQLGRDGDGAKPKRVSLPRGMDPNEINLQQALGLLALPRTLGVHPETGKPVRAGVGRFGPYVVHGDDFRSLAAGDDVLAVAIDRALELLAQPKGVRRGATPLRELGPHPKTGEPVQLFSGRYGPYVKHGETNATLPKEVTPETVTLEQALPILAEREASSPAKGRTKGGRGTRGKPAAPRQAKAGTAESGARPAKTTTPRKSAAAKKPGATSARGAAKAAAKTEAAAPKRTTRRPSGARPKA